MFIYTDTGSLKGDIAYSVKTLIQNIQIQSEIDPLPLCQI